MFDLERFVDECKDAVKKSDSKEHVRTMLEEALSTPRDVLVAVGEPQKAGVNTLYRSDELTVLNLIWGPHMTLMPHNHNMWANIGIYTGREDNIFWRPETDEPNSALKAAGARALCEGHVASLGEDVIHSVTNPVQRLTGALHIYGGDFFGEPRSEWDPETLLEGPYDVDKNLALFEESNARAGVSGV